MNFYPLLGIVVILAVAFAFSSNRKSVSLRLVLSALASHFLLALFILKTNVGQTAVRTMANAFSALYGFSGQGASFVFGELANVARPWGFVFIVQVVSIIIFFGALMSLLFHLGIIQALVKAVSFLIRPILGTSGAETLCAVANSMLGQTEAPLLVRHYLKDMTRSEMLVVMVSGMATLSGALLAVYGSLGVPIVHLLSASVMAIPASILIAKILIPEDGKPKTMGGESVELKSESANVLDAISSGTVDGMMLAANVAAMLIAFISLIALVNALLAWFYLPSLNSFFATIFRPFALLLGVAKQDQAIAGQLLGTKLVINEFVAYTEFVKSALTPRSKVILTYALAGFSNFSCIGIQIGGIGALVPEKRKMLTQLGLVAVLGGTLANFLNAAVAALLV